jgi:hypothetical protein
MFKDHRTVLRSSRQMLEENTNTDHDHYDSLHNCSKFSPVWPTKRKVYTNNLQITDSLKENVCHKTRAISVDVLCESANLKHCFPLCMDARGNHFQYLIQWDATSQCLQCVPTTSDHHSFINRDSIATLLEPLVTGSTCRTPWELVYKTVFIYALMKWEMCVQKLHVLLIICLFLLLNMYCLLCGPKFYSMPSATD